MKDASKYIEYLIEDYGPTVKVSKVNENTYSVVITQDLKFSIVRYSDSMWRDDREIKWIRNQLKTYLSQLNFKITVDYINYPKQTSIKLKPLDYEIKRRQQVIKNEK